MATTTRDSDPTTENTTEPDVEDLRDSIEDPTIPVPIADHREVATIEQWHAAIDDPDVTTIDISDSADLRDQRLTVPAGTTVNVHGDARIGAIEGAGLVTLDGRAHVDEVGGDTTVTSMSGRSRIGVLADSAHAVEMTDRAKIATVTNHATVSAVREHGRIGEVGGNARVIYLHAPAKIGAVNGNARVEGRDAAARVGKVSDTAYVAPRAKSTTARSERTNTAGRSGPTPRIGRAVTNTSRTAHRFVRGEIDRELAVGRSLAAEAASHEARH